MSSVPYVVLAWPISGDTPVFAAETVRLWTDAEDAVDELVRVLGGTDRAGVDKAFLHATERLGLLGRRLAATVAVPATGTLPPPVRVHSDYFRIRHAELSPEQHAAQAVTVLHRTVADLRYGMLEVNDVIAELTGARLVLRTLRPAAGARSDDAGPEPEWFEPDGDWMDRWLLVHHCYFLLNLHAAAELHRAADLATTDPAGAAAALSRAAVLISAFTASMLHSGAMPAAYYEETIRPTMSPPRVPINLTGVMQPEHRIYRAALKRLLAVLDAPYAELAGAEPALAAARDDVLNADLLDIERHITVAAVLVGSGRSLVQKAAAGSAVSTLREMRHLRAVAYRDLLQSGERWLG
ncbi:hypothetical protein AB0G04_08945 [Actinoplanes sp. NPDC023801]|uniref:hypothetical protein n=1 Tax=Actinoplanes sp. NPDC023801 TaxID=3154595 RepID=UPI0033F3EE66